MKYRADIDGLRALAVLLVVLFHAHLFGMSGSFVGVDIFFVISGYLICALIASEIEAGQFSLVRFYERRCRRILPALFFPADLRRRDRHLDTAATRHGGFLPRKNLSRCLKQRRGVPCHSRSSRRG